MGGSCGVTRARVFPFVFDRKRIPFGVLCVRLRWPNRARVGEGSGARIRVDCGIGGPRWLGVDVGSTEGLAGRPEGFPGRGESGVPRTPPFRL